MPMKDFFRKIQPLQLYIVLILTILFFITELIVSHLTHALTLLMDSYHMLCNILALSGCIATIKYGTETHSVQLENNAKSEENSESNAEDITLKTECHDKKGVKLFQRRTNKQERKLKNTFGWTRIDILTMLICCVFLASFCFSVYMEALQTLAHIDHQDAIHHPISVLCIGIAGLLLNGLCYILIGGYTYHQGSFLQVTENGDVVLNKVVVNNSLKQGDRRLSQSSSSTMNTRQGIWEITRDIIGSAWVIICSIIVIFTNPEIGTYVDPIISLVSSTCIMFLSYPYIRESCMILLQTIPHSINIDELKNEMVKKFPDIINVHDFHIWQMTTNKVISTIHIIFENPKVYRIIMDEIKEFLIENGVTQVTIQPEFFNSKTSIESLPSLSSPMNNNKLLLPPQCLFACQGELCKLNHCCQSYQDLNLFKTSSSKEVLPLSQDPSIPMLKSVKIIDDELSLSSSSSSSQISNCNSNSELNKSNIEEIEENKVIVENVNAKVEDDVKL